MSTPDSSVSIEVAAHRLAIRFTEIQDLPTRVRALSDPSYETKKFKEGTIAEARFARNVAEWKQVIEMMFSKLEFHQVWRFITVTPHVSGSHGSVTENEDFCNFIDYMRVRRDEEGCSPNELGLLALLSVDVQRKIESQMNQTT